MSSENKNQDDDFGRQWHLDKNVSVTHIFSTIAAIAALVVLGARFDTRLSLIEQTIQIQHATNIKQEENVAEFKREIRGSMDNISNKLDRLIERGR